MKIVFRCAPSLIDLLPRPVPARAMLPDWLRQMAARAPSELHQRSIRTVKQCPPFVDAMSHGFMLMLPCDVRVEQQRFSWDWALPPLQEGPHTELHGHPRSPLSFHVAEQLAGSPFAQSSPEHGAQAALKFNSFWTIELEPGWSLMATHPINRPDLPFRLLTGLVEADSFNAVGINFPAVWTDPDFNGLLPRGTPIAQCFPVPRQAIELVCEPMSPAHLTSYDALAGRIMAGPGVYRKGFRNKRGA